MTYDAVSAYTVLVGDGDRPPRLSVHGSAEDAWQALDALIRPGSRAGWWRGRRRDGAPVDPAAVREAAERWRGADPASRCWQVAPHRLQVTVPAIART